MERLASCFRRHMPGMLVLLNTVSEQEYGVPFPVLLAERSEAALLPTWLPSIYPCAAATPSALMVSIALGYCLPLASWTPRLGLVLLVWAPHPLTRKVLLYPMGPTRLRMLALLVTPCCRRCAGSA
ncbi:hypothetical protein [Hyperthermus butylicus]|uniref:hypothetical protein n=1 Tax=Hyperthermus butylicus TaxID=54248 RepID=UPI00064F4FFF|nr:hypothetical protein [Hyperthermus butylicus]